MKKLIGIVVSFALFSSIAFASTSANPSIPGLNILKKLQMSKKQQARIGVQVQSPKVVVSFWTNPSHGFDQHNCLHKDITSNDSTKICHIDGDKPAHITMKIVDKHKGRRTIGSDTGFKMKGGLTLQPGEIIVVNEYFLSHQKFDHNTSEESGWDYF